MPQKKAEVEDINIWIPAEKQWHVAAMLYVWGVNTHIFGHDYGVSSGEMSHLLSHSWEMNLKQIILDVLVKQPSTSSATC